MASQTDPDIDSRNHHACHRSHQTGFSLIELMVGALIGMIGIIVIFQMLDVSEKRKRTTGAGADAQISGTMALYSLERDLRQAGLGFGMAASSTYGNLLGCSVAIYDGNAPVRSFSQTLSPAVISDGTDGAPDTLTIWWGNPTRQSAATAFSSATDTSKLTGSRTGIEMGELLVAGFGSNCHLLEVTSNVDVDGSTINHESGAAYTDVTGTARTARYNKSGGWGMSFSQGYLFNLGLNAQLTQWQVSNAQLSKTDVLRNGAAVAVADGIIDLQAQYGVDNDNDGLISDAEWQATAPGNWNRLRAVRIAVLARSKDFDKDFDATNPVWGNGIGFVMKNLDGSSGTTTPADSALHWKKYRYRVYESIVPFRNVLWGMQ
jgi:type IV pilus assembly protein PilW